MGDQYSLGVKHWERAYSLSSAYMDRNIFNREDRKLSGDFFHYRNFTNPADKRKFDDCLTKGFEFIEKALAVSPEYADAILFKGLLCREKQKASEDEAERGRWAAEAMKLAAKARDILRRKEGRQ